VTDIQLRLPSVFAIVAIASAGAFAAGRSTSASTSAHSVDCPPAAPEPVVTAPDNELPPGHPAIGDQPPGDPHPAEAEGEDLAWQAPPRWQSVPNASSMRLATYRVPRAPGDSEDGDVSVTRAGGSVDANVERWIGQFDEASQKTAKKVTKKMSGFAVTIVEVNGTFGGGMGGGGSKPGWGLLGAIVSTPGMPYFFKITGPSKTVASARAELESMLGTLSKT
jgi:hypothetical protein